MIDKEQHPQTDLPKDISPLERDHTYGEKMYDFVFGNLLNFWINLSASAAFSFWVAHARNPSPLFGNRVPRDVQATFGNWIERRWFMKGIKDDTKRLERSHSMATLLTLLTPGHLIVIPSVWLGAKIKPAFVEYFDRRHYGEEAELDPSIQYRHHQVETESRATLFGTLAGRVGSVIATQLVARGFGTEGNWANKLGEKINNKPLTNWRGVDSFCESVGEDVGNTLHHRMPGLSITLNRMARKHNISWSDKQIRYNEAGKTFAGHTEVLDTSRHYNRLLRDISRYVGQDVLYSFITAVSVHPIISFLNQHLPGMKYKPKPKAEPHSLPAPEAPAQHAAEMREPAAEEKQDTPKAEVSHISHETRIAHTAQKSAQVTG